MTFSSLKILVLLITAVAGQCTTRRFIQTIHDVVASGDCDLFNVLMTGNASECTSHCLTASYDCTILTFKRGKEIRCNFFAACTDIWFLSGYTTVRKSCRADCPEVRVKKQLSRSGTCNITLTEYNVPGRERCLSLCLDTDGCRGATYTEGTCSLHGCASQKYFSGRLFMQLECLGTPQTSENPTMILTEITSTTTTIPSTKLASVSKVTIPIPSTTMATSRWTRLTEEKMEDLGFLDNPTNIAILSSVGGILVLTSLCTCCVCLLVPRIGRRRNAVVTNRSQD